jgi:glycosyltransferase involved in cell wall biosynthesis
MAKKKILLLSDDIRVHSGVGTMSRRIVFGSVHKYDWVQMAGAIKHPENGKVQDVSTDVQKETGVQDASVKLYPCDGYGNQQLLRQVIAIEKPDGIIHFTDPRFWDWLYAMEHEIRQEIPIMYYNIWDDLPFPHWNENAYESCDALMAISKQTYNINRNVCQRKPRVEGKDLFYVQHGICQNTFHPIFGTENTDYENFKKDLLRDKEYDFIAFFNSRNIRRKNPSDLISAFANLTDKLTKEKADRCALLLHTDPIDEHGTNLPKVADIIAPGRNIIFSNKKIPPQVMNFMYNVASVTCQPSSAEGFGLSHMESMMAGTPTIATVIGGLQDQMGFKVDGREVTTDDFTSELPSNSTGKMSKEHGEWVYPLWPNQSLQGSPPTPYIYDSRPTIGDITKALEYWYHMPIQDRIRKGIAARNWAIDNGFTDIGMCNAMMDAIDTCLKTFVPRETYELFDMSEEKPKYPSGVLL